MELVKDFVKAWIIVTVFVAFLAGLIYFGVSFLFWEWIYIEREAWLWIMRSLILFSTASTVAFFQEFRKRS